MAEENANTMNLDLNLGPVDDSVDSGEPPYTNAAMNLADWLDGPVHRVREVVRQRNHRWRSLWRQIPIPPETRSLALELVAPQTGEASVEVTKMCENTTASVENEDLGKKKDGTTNGDEGSFFDCNICLDLAEDPIVTCCGHLFCWPCLYQWLHHHSDAKECPVCKGEVTTKNITPIYGRGNPTRESDLDPSLKIPFRPHARRVESWRQTFQRTTSAFTFPMEEMIRRLGSAFDLNRELAHIQSRDSDDPLERTNALLNRFLNSRGMHRDDVVEARDRDRDRSQLSSMLLRRSSSHRDAEGLTAVESYFHGDDRDSVSSIAAVIHSESQTVDNAIEIDSTTSSSRRRRRRRSDASRVSDVDSGDSRRRRLS